jgi:hypothetical protein
VRNIRSPVDPTRMECVMADRDLWEKVESVSKSFAAVGIPVVLALGGLFANQVLEKSKVKQDLLKQAIEVVFLSKAEALAGDGTSFESRRAHRKHWLEFYNSLADVKLSSDFISIVMEQDTLASEKEVYWTGNMPTLIAKYENSEDTNEDGMGHGWVDVGRLNSKQYSDVNFDIPQNGSKRDGTIKPGQIMQARWSVTLRSNNRNLEDRQGYTGTSRGLLWGGECAKVVDSVMDRRDQTWAFIEIVQCPALARSDRKEQRAMSHAPPLIR